VGINYGNPNNATRDAAGLLHGVAVDMACVLARRLGVEVQFIGYPGVPPLMQGLANGEFTIGFTQDPGLGPTNIAYANPHVGVENTYLVPAGSSIQTVADADQPGVRISVATGNAPDVYLTNHLQFAQLVRFSTVPQALAALKNGAVDAFSGSRSAEVTFVNTQMPGGRVLTENIFIANLAQVLPLGLPDALRYLNRFVETGKISFLIQFAVCRAGLIGVSVPPPLTIGKQHDSEEDLSDSARTVTADKWSTPVDVGRSLTRWPSTPHPLSPGRRISLFLLRADRCGPLQQARSLRDHVRQVARLAPADQRIRYRRNA